MRALLVLAILAPTLLAAVPAGAQEPLRRSRSQQGDVYSVGEDDRKMQAAIERARATLATFDGYLPRAARGEVSAALKVRFTEGDETEHMWVTGLTRDPDGRYHGTLASTPMALRGVSEGDRVTAGPDEVSDWLVLAEDGTLIGGFTLVELARRMEPGERAAYEQSQHFRIPADSAVWNLPRSPR
jgi:uncharacterized protein YegJ (DUF2314 family)